MRGRRPRCWSTTWATRRWAKKAVASASRARPPTTASTWTCWSSPAWATASWAPAPVHHVAFRTADDAEQLEYKDALTAVGLGPTPVQDRQYFHSIYFREPAGTLFEIATDAPGFAWDEPVDSLGRELKLPPWLEGQRAVVDARLPVLVNPGICAAE
ncbi:MAG: VOC family protein [Caldilineaceae bacterium]